MLTTKVGGKVSSQIPKYELTVLQPYFTAMFAVGSKGKQWGV